jgi:hypothetical protein
MPSIADAIQSAENLSGYSPNAPASNGPGLPSVGSSNEPTRNNMMRTPMPTLWNDSSDSLRQFYIGGQVPQTRFMSPLVGGSTSAPSSGGNIVAGVSSGGVPSGSSSSSGSGGSGGSGGGGSSTPVISAAQFTVTTPVIVPGQVFSGSVMVSPSLQLLMLTATAACRVQIYGSRLAQLQDASRPVDTAPPAGISPNIVTDVFLDTLPFQWGFQNRTAANTETPQTGTLYVTVTNVGSISSAITVTLSYVPLET